MVDCKIAFDVWFCHPELDSGSLYFQGLEIEKVLQVVKFINFLDTEINSLLIKIMDFI
jgi:hypothetical protein